MTDDSKTKYSLTPASLGNPYNDQTSLIHTKNCTCETCQTKAHSEQQPSLEAAANKMTALTKNEVEDTSLSNEDMLDRAVENAIVRGIFGQNDLSRRKFMNLVGGSHFINE